MDKEIITTRAPRAIGPYSQGRVVNDLLFTSGQLPLDPETGKMIDGSISALTRQCLHNLAAIAEAAGTSLRRAVKINIYLRNSKHAAEVNAVYSTFFAAPYPARSSVQVAGLPLDAEIEMDAVIPL